MGSERSSDSIDQVSTSQTRLNDGSAERVCENSRFFGPNDGMISVFDTEAVYEAIYRRSGPSAGDFIARIS